MENKIYLLHLCLEYIEANPSNLLKQEISMDEVKGELVIYRELVTSSDNGRERSRLHMYKFDLFVDVVKGKDLNLICKVLEMMYE